VTRGVASRLSRDEYVTVGILMRIPPLRPFDRVVAGYATLAFALAAGESFVVRDWLIAAAGVLLSAAGLVLLAHDHRRWRRGD
jgi:hypothetical protein